MARTTAISTAEAALHEQESHLSHSRLVFTVTILGLILAVVTIDANGLSTALPTIAADLHATDTISWAGTASILAHAVFSVLYGRFSDVFGRKPLFVIACLVFAAAELLCGFAVNGTMLYVARALTGLSGGGLVTLATIVASDIVPLAQRGLYQGYCGAFIGLGNLGGPFIAAAFVDRATWRAFVWLLSPLGVICALSAWWVLPPTKAPGSVGKNLAKIDWIGSFASTVAIVFFLVPISGGGSYFAWNSAMIISMLVISGVSFIAFVWWEARFANLPIIPMSIFKTLDVCALTIQVFLLGWTTQVPLFFLPLYYQNLRTWTPLVSAALLTPVIVTAVFASIGAGRYISVSKHYGSVIRFGTVAGLLGAGLTILLDRGTPAPAIVFLLLPLGIGSGCTGQPLVVALQAHTPNRQRAVVISCRTFVRFLGASCGLAVSSAVLQSGLQQALPEEYKSFAKQVYALPKLTPATEDAVGPAYATAIQRVFIVNTALAGLAVGLCFLWKDRGLQRPEEREDEAEGSHQDEAAELGDISVETDIPGNSAPSKGGLDGEKRVPTERIRSSPKTS